MDITGEMTDRNLRNNVRNKDPQRKTSLVTRKEEENQQQARQAHLKEKRTHLIQRLDDI